MLNEKPANPADWKNKLEALESIPGEPDVLVHEKWAQLHERLMESKTQNSFSWNWIAAACMLLIVLIPLHTSFNKIPAIIKNRNSKASNSEALTLQTKHPDNPVATNNVSNKIIIKQSHLLTTGRIGDTMGAGTSRYSNGNEVSKNDAVLVAAVELEGAHSIDSITSTPPLVVARKKLKVVHINELGMQVEEPMEDKRYAERQPGYRNLINQQSIYHSSGEVNIFTGDLRKARINSQN